MWPVSHPTECAVLNGTTAQLIAGGGTKFPKARRHDGGEGLYVPATRGSFVFFYDLLEDGNVDVLSLHSGTKVKEGEKWVAPLWLWY